MKHRTDGNSRKYNAAWYQALKNEEDSVRGFNSKFKEPGKQFGKLDARYCNWTTSIISKLNFFWWNNFLYHGNNYSFKMSLELSYHQKTMVIMSKMLI